MTTDGKPRSEVLVDEVEAQVAIDGRVLRGQRNKERIVEAIVAILRESDETPTAEKIAERAQVGLRTLFRHFEDMQSLYAAVSARVLSEVIPMFRDVRFEGDLATRVRQLVELRIRIFEHIAPFQNRGGPGADRSQVLLERERAMDAVSRQQAREAIGPGLDEVASDRAEALYALLSFPTWDRIARIHGRSSEDAARIVARGVLALLGAAPD